MNSFVFFLLCTQMCMIQNVYSQCLGAAGPLGTGYYGAGVAPFVRPGLEVPYGLGASLAASPFRLSPTAIELGAAGPYGLAPTAVEIAGAYGGSGIGDIVVTGEMPVAGSTLIAGQVPILGAVRFTGDLPAAGTLSIAGSSGCGCGNAPYYSY